MFVNVVYFLSFAAFIVLVPKQVAAAVADDGEIRINKSKDVLSYMNLTVNPCLDFYAYACDNWDRNRPQFRDRETKIATDYLQNKIDHDLQFLLEEQYTLDDGLDGRKVKDFYKSCKNANANGQIQQAFHSQFIKSNGGFPAVPGSNWTEHHILYDWQRIVAELRGNYGMDILIGIDIDLNPLNQLENSIYLTEPSTIIPTELCSAEHTRNMSLEKFAVIEKEVVTNLKTWLSLQQKAAEKVATEILTFEYELCTAMQIVDNATINEDNMYLSSAYQTLSEFTRLFNNTIDFHRIVTISFGIPMSRPVYMFKKHYYQHLIDTIKLHDNAILANYIMYRALSMLSFPLEDNRRTRPLHCTKLTKHYFSQPLGYMYYRKYGNALAKEKIEEIFKNLKTVFQFSLQSAWLDDGASRVGLDKLKDINLLFPTYDIKPSMSTLTIDSGNFWSNLAKAMKLLQEAQLPRILASENARPSDEVEAYEARIKYHAKFQRIDVGWALLQPPYYHESYPKSMIYATIGQKLGRELATAFDDLNWTTDSYRTPDVRRIPNWDALTARGYQNRSECFRQQISNYLFNYPNQFSNATQLREIIAMSGGVNAAFSAYLIWLGLLNPVNQFQQLTKETLPALNFSNTQLFFLTYAQMYCQQSELSSSNFAISCPLQSHTLARYLINGPLSNSVQFGTEFNCPIGAEMNLADKCVIY